MKILSLLFFYSFSLRAEVFTFFPEHGKEQKIEIKKWDHLLVSENCLKNKKECLKIIDSVRKTPLKEIPQSPSSHAASANCEAHNGQSEILRDHKNNEYDFCLFQNKYFIDSWALMRSK